TEHRDCRTPQAISLPESLSLWCRGVVVRFHDYTGEEGLYQLLPEVNGGHIMAHNAHICKRYFLGSRSDTEDWIDVAEMVREDRIIVKATGFFSRLGSFRMTSVGGA